jgi:hypothetical protein
VPPVTVVSVYVLAVIAVLFNWVKPFVLVGCVAGHAPVARQAL